MPELHALLHVLWIELSLKPVLQTNLNSQAYLNHMVSAMWMSQRQHK